MITVNATFFIFDSSLNVSAWCPLLGVLWNFKYYPKKVLWFGWLLVKYFANIHTGISDVLHKTFFIWDFIEI